MKNSIKSCVISFLIGFFLQMNAAAQTKCMVADYPLNGNVTDIFAALNGTLNGTTPTKDRFGRANYALQFNGSSDWVKLGTDADFKERTISLWFKVDTFLTGGKYALVFTTDNANLKYGGIGFAIDNVGGKNRISVGAGINTLRYTSALKNTWYHAALVVNTTHIKVFINGQLFDSTLNNSLSHSNDGDTKAHLGCNRNSNALFFKGAIDDVKIFNCALSNAAVDSLYKVQMACPVAFYNLNGDANDASGNNFNGTLYGTTPTQDRFGNANSALKFNGTSDWVRLGTDADLAERTISLWFKVDTFIGNGNFGLVFSTDNANLMYGGIGLAVDNVGGKNRISTGVGVNILRYTDAFTNVWYHYALVVNSSHFKFYLNGNLIDSMVNSNSHSLDGDNYAHLGCSRKNDRYFNGSIDDVKIYSCALSKTEISKLYTLSNKSIIKNTTFLKIFPNPANEKLKIEMQPGETQGVLEIYNIQGQNVMEIELNQSQSLVDISKLSKGVYTLKLINGLGTAAAKLIKQ